MTQQLLRRREVDGRAVERVKARYQADGFEVSFWRDVILQGSRHKHSPTKAPDPKVR